DGLPEAITQGQCNGVFGEFRAARERQRFRIVCVQRDEVAFHQRRKAGSITIGGTRGRSLKEHCGSQRNDGQYLHESPSCPWEATSFPSRKRTHCMTMPNSCS